MKFKEELMQYIKDQSSSYYIRKIESVKSDIKSTALQGGKGVWVTFYWADGNATEVIEYFEREGIKVSCPTGDGKTYTDYYFYWSENERDDR